MPTVSKHLSATCADASKLIPSSANTSAVPVLLVILRFPCFATRTPHAAIAIAAAVLMLNVFAPSPPVPHVSTTGRVPPVRHCIESRIATAAPASSSAVSPFCECKTRNSRIDASSASPLSIQAMQDRIWSAVKSCLAFSCSSQRANSWDMDGTLAF